MFAVVFSACSHCSYLPPANEVWGEVIFLHLFVILFTRGGWMVPGGGWSWGVHGPGGGGCMVLGGMHGSGGDWWRPPGRLLLRAVRILLECILVPYFISVKTTDFFDAHIMEKLQYQLISFSQKTQMGLAQSQPSFLNDAGESYQATDLINQSGVSSSASASVTFCSSVSTTLISNILRMLYRAHWARMTPLRYDGKTVITNYPQHPLFSQLNDRFTRRLACTPVIACTIRV